MLNSRYGNFSPAGLWTFSRIGNNHKLYWVCISPLAEELLVPRCSRESRKFPRALSLKVMPRSYLSGFTKLVFALGSVQALIRPPREGIAEIEGLHIWLESGHWLFICEQD